MSVLAHDSETSVTSKDQLIGYFARGEKPKMDWKIGCEHEKFPYRLTTLQPVSYQEQNGIRDLLSGLTDYGWKPVMEGTTVIGLTRGDAAISLEPGGAVELAGAPQPDLHEVSAEIEQHLTEACDIGEQLGIGFLGMGFHPTAKRDDVPWMPKKRYEIMRAYMPKVGNLGHDMMLRTCTTQVNLDYGSEADMIKKFRVALALQPIATALFASSPFTESTPNGFSSYRMEVWQDVDADRCGTLPFVFDEGFGYERYADYALDVPMYFIWRDNRYIDCAGQSFRDFMKGQLPALPNEYPTLNDWGNHLTTLFPDVRLKKFLEMRGADVGTNEMILALPAFWVGLLYDERTLDSAWDIVKEWTMEDHLQLHLETPRLGFQAEMRGRKVLDIAHQVITLAQQGLRRRAIRLHGGADEARYLEILFNLTESGHSPADQMLLNHQLAGGFDVQRLFDTNCLRPPARSDEAT